MLELPEIKSPFSYKHNNKIALITDTHWGVRNDNPIFYDYFDKFNKIFFQTLKERSIFEIIHLGDFYDRRKYINLQTAHRAKVGFLNKLTRLWPARTHFIVGNHDCYYKNTNEVNSLHGTFGYHPDWWCIHTEPSTIIINEIPILLLPWINQKNEQLSLNMIQNTEANLCFGHLAIKGFQEQLGHFNHDGLDSSLFKRFDVVASGHFHTKSKKGNINYLGANAEFNWGDYNDPRGFHIFDLETREFEFIKNPYSVFHMIVYDDVNQLDQMQSYTEVDFAKFEKCYVKIVVLNKVNQYLFDSFIEKINNVAPVDISVVENVSAFAETEATGEIDLNVDDTLSIMNNYVDSLEMPLEPDKMKSIIKKIYTEATVLSGD